MLSLSQKLSLNTIKTNASAWTPDPSRDNLRVWWRKATDVTSDASAPYGVSLWRDQSGNNYHLEQSTASEQPEAAGNVGQNNGEIWFDPANSQNLDLQQQLTVTGDFTIAIKCKVFNVGGCLLADNTSPGEFMKFTSTVQLRMKFANGGALNIALDSGTWNDGNVTNLIITRVVDTGEIKMWRNGVEQSGSATSAEDFLVDNLGLRRTDLNPFDGWVSDISIYLKKDDDLTANLNDYLNSI